MVLRASAESSGETIDLRAITDRARSIGNEHGDLLLDFADAVLGADAARLRRIQDRIAAELSPAALAGASAIAANFSRNDRIANAIGIPLEREFVEQGADIRELLGIDRYASARNTLGVDAS